MPRYAVEIGKVVLKSDKPITEDEHRRGLEEWRRRYPGTIMVTEDGLEVAVSRQRP